MDDDRINYERLWEASDEALARAHEAALKKAHDAPKDDDPPGRGAAAWARFSQEANRIGDEIARRKRRACA